MLEVIIMNNTYKIMEVNMDTLVPKIISDTHVDSDLKAGEILKSMYPNNMVLFEGKVVGDCTYNGDIVLGISDEENCAPLGDSNYFIAKAGNIFYFLKWIDSSFRDSLYLLCDDGENFVHYKLKPLERESF